MVKDLGVRQQIRHERVRPLLEPHGGSSISPGILQPVLQHEAVEVGVVERIERGYRLDNCPSAEGWHSSLPPLLIAPTVSPTPSSRGKVKKREGHGGECDELITVG